MDIIALLVCLDQSVDRTTIQQLSQIIVSMLTMTGRVTMLGIARWSEKGGSYRTVQRCFAKTLPWASMSWLFVRAHLLRAGDEYVLAGDETIVTKAGKQSFGLDGLRPVADLFLFFDLWQGRTKLGLLCAFLGQR